MSECGGKVISGHLVASGDGELWLMVGEESLDEMSLTHERVDVKETEADGFYV